MIDLEISDNFTVDDIHRVREYHYELTKNMSEDERSAYYADKAAAFLAASHIPPFAKRNGVAWRSPASMLYCQCHLQKGA